MSKPVDSHYQRGAIGVFAALVLLLAILFTALAVDSARLWMVKRQLQRIADMSAISAASGLSCNPDLDNILGLAQEAATRNGFTGSLTTPPNTLNFGVVNTIEGRRFFNPNGNAEAVRVVVSNTVSASLIAGSIFGDQLTLSAEAVAIPNVPIASFGIGTGALGINTEESALLNQLFSQILGSPINLGVASYRGLADTSLTLANLITAQGQALTVSELLDLSMNSADGLRLIADALNLNSNVVTSVINDTMLLANSAARNTTLRLGEVIDINGTSNEALNNTSINLLSLITSLLTISNGQNAINFPLSVNVPNLASVDSSLRIINAPKVVIGPAADSAGNVCTNASSAQIALQVTAQIAGTLDMKLNFNVASANVSLMRIQSADATTNLEFGVQRGLLTTSLTNLAENRPASLLLLGLPIAELSLNFSPPTPGNSEQIQTEIARPVNQHLPAVVSSGNPNGPGFEDLFSQPTSLTVSVLGINLPVINQLVSTVVRPLLIQISRSLLDPLAKLFGIQTNNVDILLQDVRLINPNPLVI